MIWFFNFLIFFIAVVCDDMKSNANHVRPGYSYCLPENTPTINTITIGEEFIVGEIEAFIAIKGEYL